MEQQLINTVGVGGFLIRKDKIVAISSIEQREGKHFFSVHLEGVKIESRFFDKRSDAEVAKHHLTLKLGWDGKW